MAKTTREKGRELFTAVFAPFKTGTVKRLTDAAAPFATALASLEARNANGELRRDYFIASRAELLNQRRAAVRAATFDLKRELRARAEALRDERDAVPATPAQFTAATQTAQALALLDPDEAVALLGQVVEQAAATDQRSFLKLLLPHARSLAKQAAFDVNEPRRAQLDAVIERATDATTSEFDVARALLTDPGLDYEIDELTDVIAQHGRFDAADGDPRASAVDAEGRNGLFARLDVPAPAPEVAPGSDEDRALWHRAFGSSPSQLEQEVLGGKPLVEE